MTTVTAPVRITESDRQDLVEGLSGLLGDTFALYVATHGYHWNVIGPMFSSLHIMFEQEYIELWNAVDAIAERIRALGALAPGTHPELAHLSSLAFGDGVPSALDMVKNLAAGHSTLADSARRIAMLAERAGDLATADLVTTRVEMHEKTAWMLNATAG
jgi:starvation-inducible DNA-binding protein